MVIDQKQASVKLLNTPKSRCYQVDSEYPELSLASDRPCRPENTPEIDQLRPMGNCAILRETLKGSAQESNPRSILPNNSDFHWRVKIIKSSNSLAFPLPNHILTTQ